MNFKYLYVLCMLISLVNTGCDQQSDSNPAPAKVRFVEQGYHVKAERIDFAEIGTRMRGYAELPSRLSKDSLLTVGSIWEQLNRRLKESGARVEVVMETNLHPLKADQLYFQSPIKRVFGHDVQGDALRVALEKATCEDLLSIIVENTGLHTLHRKNEIIMSNYVHQ